MGKNGVYTRSLLSLKAVAVHVFPGDNFFHVDFVYLEVKKSDKTKGDNVIGYGQRVR